MKLPVISTVLIASVMALAIESEARPSKDGELPPGLQKKVDRGGQLPPGWQDRIQVGQVLEHDIYVHGEVVVPVGSHGSVTIQIGERLLRLHEKTREILEILH